MIKVAITGAGGRVAYNLIFEIVAGRLFKDEEVELNLIDLTDNIKTVEGVMLEIEDCASATIKKINIGTDIAQLFQGINYAFLLGSRPRKKGMDRKDLLLQNSEIFVKQGKALDEHASRDVRVLVVGNPCNTNCLICLKNAPTLSPMQFCSLSRLDQNRALFQIAKACNRSPKELSSVIIWGNHSDSQVVDLVNVKVKDESAHLEDFGYITDIVRARGKSIIDKMGCSSAGSTANAIIDNVLSWHDGSISSAGVHSANNSYGIDPDICFSFPVQAKGTTWQIVDGYTLTDHLREQLKITENELKEERESVKHLL